MKAIKHIICLLLMMSFFFAKGQVKTNFNSEKIIGNRGYFLKNYRARINHGIPEKNINELLQRDRRVDSLSNDVKPFRLAEPVAVDLNITDGMNWIYDSGYAYGKSVIHLRGVLTASIYFDRFYCPAGREMYMYN